MSSQGLELELEHLHSSIVRSCCMITAEMIGAGVSTFYMYIYLTLPDTPANDSIFQAPPKLYLITATVLEVGRA